MNRKDSLLIDFHRWLPFLPDSRTYWLALVTFQTDGGDTADGPLIRQGPGRRELLAWTEKGPAEAAAQALALQTGGAWRVKAASRKAILGACRDYAFGGRLVAVILQA